ncbi:unknown [Acidaminococcus sp. CAG:917]|nr:unknown [Acidaminococcus sp. CAG:917]
MGFLPLLKKVILWENYKIYGEYKIKQFRLAI